MTGGAGFIGSNLVDALTGRGERVVVIDDLSTGRRENLAGSPAELRVLDIVDAAAVGEALDEARPDRVFHLAAQIDVRRSVADPAFDARVNVEGTATLLAAARASDVKRVVFASTGGALYGDAAVVPTPEDAPIAPLAPYGQAKHAAEGYLSLYHRLHGMSTIALRFANVYGPRQDPLGEAGVVGIFCGSRLNGGRPTVYGDGTQTRDFVYVGDVVEALLAAGDADRTGAYNVGTGAETSVLELAAAFGEDFTPVHAEARPGEVGRSCLDVTKIAQELGWRAATPLAEGLERTLQPLRTV
ncbi:MAG: NAD-dependent epimerase/dehydratase [Solirubrobacterales bacterium]|nr:NAD-dependent epimerase/dehydratase [Solirubrobacterales bacterium]